jgi:hypothetical protein
MVAAWEERASIDTVDEQAHRIPAVVPDPRAEGILRQGTPQNRERRKEF